VAQSKGSSNCVTDWGVIPMIMLCSSLDGKPVISRICALPIKKVVCNERRSALTRKLKVVKRYVK
jgi:hypothetical protein